MTSSNAVPTLVEDSSVSYPCGYCHEVVQLNEINQHGCLAKFTCVTLHADSSNIQVLVGVVREEKRTAFSWPDEMTFNLLHLKAELINNRPLIRGNYRDDELNRKLSNSLRDVYRFTATSEQVKSKLKGLKVKYNNQRQAMTATGLGGHKSSWLFYDVMHEIYGGRADAHPAAVVSSTQGMLLLRNIQDCASRVALKPPTGKIGARKSAYTKSYYDLSTEDVESEIADVNSSVMSTIPPNTSSQNQVEDCCSTSLASREESDVTRAGTTNTRQLSSEERVPLTLTSLIDEGNEPCTSSSVISSHVRRVTPSIRSTSCKRATNCGKGTVVPKRPCLGSLVEAEGNPQRNHQQGVASHFGEILAVESQGHCDEPPQQISNRQGRLYRATIASQQAPKKTKDQIFETYVNSCVVDRDRNYKLKERVAVSLEIIAGQRHPLPCNEESSAPK